MHDLHPFWLIKQYVAPNGCCPCPFQSHCKLGFLLLGKNSLVLWMTPHSFQPAFFSKTRRFPGCLDDFLKRDNPKNNGGGGFDFVCFCLAFGIRQKNITRSCGVSEIFIAQDELCGGSIVHTQSAALRPQIKVFHMPDVGRPQAVQATNLSEHPVCMVG